jgi:hypothetical protein
VSAVVSGIVALLGFAVFRNFSPGVIAATTALAAGSILSMLVDIMIPEVFQKTHSYPYLITIAGFLIAFALSKVAGREAGGSRFRQWRRARHRLRGPPPTGDIYRLAHGLAVTELRRA